MSDFESIVRPFQLPDASPPRRYVSAKQQSAPTILLMFGRSGSGRTFGGSYSARIERYSPFVASEDKRAYKNPKYEINWPSFSANDYGFGSKY